MIPKRPRDDTAARERPVPEWPANDPLQNDPIQTVPRRRPARRNAEVNPTSRQPDGRDEIDRQSAPSDVETRIDAISGSGEGV